MTSSQLPTRTNTEGGYLTDDDAPAGDPSSTTGLLTERLQAWKHMCGYLENYISTVAKDQHTQAKDQEKILKTLSHPLKEGHHFETALGGVSGLFENLRANTQAQSNLHTETSKNLTGSVLPILERLHSEIKNKAKELEKGAGKGSKAVDASRNASQKHIELLGHHTATFDSTGGKVTANNDPYVLHRGVYHRLNKQLLDENNNRQDVIAVQNSFQQFEAHVLTTVQTAMNSFNQYMSRQADRQKAMYGDVASNAQNIPQDYEWNGFLKRNGHVLVSPNAPSRTMDNISFPNQGHRATRPLIEGSLERKSRGMGALKGYSSYYYAVTPAGYLHEFKDNDNYNKDPTPETSLYLPDCLVGAVDGVKFAIKGKDSSGGKIGSKMSLSSEYSFKAHSAEDAQHWHAIISQQTSGTTNSVPTSPVESRNVTPIHTGGTVGEQEKGVTSASSGPMSATGAGTTPESAQKNDFASPTSAGTNQYEDRKYTQ